MVSTAQLFVQDKLCKNEWLFTQPKVRSQRSISRAHTTSVKPVNRTFAAQDNAVQHVDVGVLKDVSVREPKVYLLERNLTDISHFTL